MSEALTWVVPGDPDQHTGGYLYDARIVRELRRLGWSVEVVGLAGRFPDADALAAESMDAVLARLPDGARVVIDGLALGGVPDTVVGQAERLDISALIHHPLADETGLDSARRERFLSLERRALAACRRVIVTSAFTARRLQALGLDDRKARVVEPGVDSVPLAKAAAARLDGRDPDAGERLLSVAALTPRKGHDVLVRALAGLVERNWHCVLAGSMQRDAAWAEKIAAAIDEAGLSGRVECLGECDAEALDAEYRRASLCVLPSHYEGYGMVVSEALARGLPMITTTGGALADTVPEDCCLKVAPGDADAFRDALSRWLADADLRQVLTQRAAARRERLRDWPGAGQAFAAALKAQAGVTGADTAGFDGDWLALREPADHAARSSVLAEALRERLERRLVWRVDGQAALKIVDLGAGSGSNLRWLAPRLPGPQEWLLIDHDPVLLETAGRTAAVKARDGSEVTVETRCLDLSEWPPGCFDGAELVTASALFDLVSRDWIEALAAMLARSGAAGLFALTVDGRRGFVDARGRAVEDGDDRIMAELFNRHQRQDKSLGEALGPGAARFLPGALERAGLQVRVERSDWLLAAGCPRSIELGSALLEDWTDAALAASAGAETGWIRRWHRERLAKLENGALGLEVGHVDVLALPIRHD